MTVNSSFTYENLNRPELLTSDPLSDWAAASDRECWRRPALTSVCHAVSRGDWGSSWVPSCVHWVMCAFRSVDRLCVWYSLETTKQFRRCFPSLCGEEILSLLNHIYVSCRSFFGCPAHALLCCTCTCGVWVCVSRKRNKQELASFNILCFLFSLLLLLLLSAATMNTHLKYSGSDLLTRDFCSTNCTALRGWWDTIQYYVDY